MANPERPSEGESKSYLNGIRFLIQKAEKRTANFFPLFGPPEEPAEVFQCLGLYPVNSLREEASLLAIPDQGYRNYSLLELVVALRSPAGNADLGRENNSWRRRVFETGLSFLPFPVPSILLILGKTSANELVARLYCLPGISLGRAFLEIQEAANQALNTMAEKN